MVTGYKFSLQRYQGPRTRRTCPGCNKPREFTLYVDNETGQPLAQHVGKCNRESKCGYHYTPAQYFADNPHLGDGEEWRQSEVWKTTHQTPKPQPVDYLPREVMAQTLRGYDTNNFARYLAQLFGKEKARQLAQRYHLGTSKRWKDKGGHSVIFWQVDKAGNIHQAKVMQYDPKTGRRLKEDGKSYVAFMGKRIAGKENPNLVQCLFGEHLLSLEPDKPACLVESEKTAVIMAAIMPHAIWLATGGKNGARWTESDIYQALEGRTVILYPDLGAFDDWKERAKILGTVCKYQVSDLLEHKAQGNDWKAGYDLADYFVKGLQVGAEEPQPRPEPVQARETGFIKPQEAAGKPEGITAPQQEEQATGGQETGLPEGFALVAGDVLEVDGLPLSWLNEEERAEAQQRMKGRELEIMQAINPNVAQLVERLGLEVEAVEPWEPKEGQ